jgi:hypothetical protein
MTVQTTLNPSNRPEIRYKSRPGRPMLDHVCETLIATNGLVAPAAKILGMDSSNLYKYIKHHARAQAAQRIASNAIDDLAESRLFKKIDQGDLKAIMFRLSRRRGYALPSGSAPLDGDQPRQITEVVWRIINPAVTQSPGDAATVIEHQAIEDVHDPHL